MFQRKNLPPLLVSVHKVWDHAEHNAFTDLLFANNRFYLCFREAHSHQNINGAIRILTSVDGFSWEPQALIEEEGFDLRDPKLSLTPDGRIMLLVGATFLDAEGDFLFHDSKVAFADQSLAFGPFVTVLERNQWLWRVTWHKGLAYGVAYTCVRDETWVCSLYSSPNGIDYTEICTFDAGERPNESTVRFLSDDRIAVLIRRDRTYLEHALLGIGDPTFNNWEWYDVGYNLGGPNFITFSNDEMWLSGRVRYITPYGIQSKTALIKKVGTKFKRVLVLPSFYDTSYPGMVWHDSYLWLSYYSSHEGKSSIYMAKVLLP